MEHQELAFRNWKSQPLTESTNLKCCTVDALVRIAILLLLRVTSFCTLFVARMMCNSFISPTALYKCILTIFFFLIIYLFLVSHIHSYLKCYKVLLCLNSKIFQILCFMKPNMYWNIFNIIFCLLSNTVALTI